MRKKLVILALVLVAAAAATAPAAAAKCRAGTYLVVCSSTLSICCPNGAACLCPPPES